MHDGTVRDVCFLEDTSNKSSLLISGGAGDCKIYVTDCATGQPYQALSGHSGECMIITVYLFIHIVMSNERDPGGSYSAISSFCDLIYRNFM